MPVTPMPCASRCAIARGLLLALLVGVAIGLALAAVWPRVLLVRVVPVIGCDTASGPCCGGGA